MDVCVIKVDKKENLNWHVKPQNQRSLLSRHELVSGIKLLVSQPPTFPTAQSPFYGDYQGKYTEIWELTRGVE